MKQSLRIQEGDQRLLPPRLSRVTDPRRFREIDLVDLPLIPFLYPERLLRSRQRSGVGRYATVAKDPSVPREHWAEVAVRAQREGLWAVARDLGVSHETVRSIVKQVELHGLPRGA